MKYNITQTENYLLIVDDSDKKIIAHLPLNGASVLEGVDLLPLIENNIEQWAWDNPCLSRKDVYTLFEEVFKEQRLDGQFSISAAKQVYEFNSKLRDLAKIKAAVVKEKYKYTDDDLRKAMHFGKFGEYNGQETTIGFIQSLQQPKMPVAFECVYQSPEDRYYEDGIGYDLNIKRTTNSQGQTVWVGKYIYETNN
jgi:hypothetical protein